jgi:hypothetical protein
MAPHVAIRRFEINQDVHRHRHTSCEKLRFKLCLDCGERTALYRTWRRPGRVAWDPSHTLCFACYRALRDSLRQTCSLAVSSGGSITAQERTSSHRLSAA